MLVLGGHPRFHDKLNIFGLSPRTLGTSEDYPYAPSKYTNSEGGLNTIPNGHWWCEKDRDYILTYGNIFDDTYPLTFEFNTNIGNHYYYTASYGVDMRTTPSDRYCPIYPPIESITFNYKKRENTGRSGCHAFRVYKVGVVERTSNSGVTIKDLSKFSSTGSNNLFSFTGPGTYEGTYTMGLSGLDINHPVGFCFQLETQGKNSGSVTGSKIEIWNLTFKFRNNNGKYYILPKMDNYSSKNPPSKYYIETSSS